MSDINIVTIIGRLTGDPQQRTTNENKAVCSFSIAVNRVYGNGEQKKEEVSYFNCVIFNKLAEVALKYLQKGNRVALCGRLKQRTWEQNGQKRQTVEIIVNELQFLSEIKKQEGKETIPTIEKDFNPFNESEFIF